MLAVGAVNNFEQTVKLHKPLALFGFLSYLFGQAFKIYDEATQRHFYLTKKGLVQAIAGQRQAPLLADRILEVVQPILGKKISLSSLRQLERETRGASSVEQLIERIETIRDRHLPKFSLQDETLLNTLKPGDLIFRKYHEEIPNPICKLQKFFKGLICGKKEREGHKYSHVAMYVGKGEIAEASMPHGKDPHVRVLKLTDARFALIPKNQYRIVRPTDSQQGAKAAEVFRSFAVDGSSSTTDESGLKYTYIEAVRSLWHFSSFGYFAKQRYLKYYADYIDQVTPTQIIEPRRLFCSNAVAMAYQIADGLNDKPKSLKQIVGDPPTKAKTPLLRALVRGIWSRFHAIVHRKELNQFVKLQYDALRSSPQDMRNYVLRNPEQFKDLAIVAG